MVMMNEQTNFLELLLGGQGDCVTPDGEVNPPLTQEWPDQRLDLNEFGYTDDENCDVTFLPDMNLLLGDVIYTKDVETTEEPSQSNETTDTTTSVLQQQQEQLIFQFPSTSQGGYSDDLLSITTGEDLLSDFTDSESTYSSTVPSTPFSPNSPFYPPPTTPDTASSSGTGSGFLNRSVKDDLRNRIKIKRKQEGKGDIKVEFVAPEPERLTEEEEAKRIEKREKNKYAAQKCREKKRQRADKLEAEIKVLEKKQRMSELDIKKLLEERDHLMDIINVHGSVCPKFRAQSSSF